MSLRVWLSVDIVLLQQQGACVFFLSCYCLDIVAKQGRRFWMAHARTQLPGKHKNLVTVYPAPLWIKVVSCIWIFRFLSHLSDVISVTFRWTHKGKTLSILIIYVTSKKQNRHYSSIHKNLNPCRWADLSFMCIWKRKSTLKRKTNTHKSGLQGILSKKCSNLHTFLVNGISAPIPPGGLSKCTLFMSS